MSVEEKYKELYLAQSDVIGDGLPIFFNVPRRGFMDDMMVSGLPDRRDEHYRESDMQALFAREWRFRAVSVTDRVLDGVSNGEFVLVNGLNRTPEQLVVRADGIAYGSLRAASFDFESVVRDNYNSIAANRSVAVTAMNSMFVQDGGFVYIPDGVRSDEPIVLEFGFEPWGDMQLFFSRLLVVAGHNSKADIVVRLRSDATHKMLVNHVGEVCLKDGARVTFVHSTDFGQEADVVVNNYVEHGRDAVCATTNVELRARMLRHNFTTNLTETGGDSTFYGLYMGAGTEHTDINVAVNHLAPYCRSEELVKGVAGGEAFGIFTGRIYVAPGAQKTEAYQTSRNLQLSPAPHMLAKPQLEIYADDVKCSHGATVGQMNDDAVYYMRQRGISEQDAHKLQMYGFVNDIVNHCVVDGERERLTEAVRAKVERL